MQETQIKEELSLHLFSAMAAMAGYSAIKPRIDIGNDILLDRIEKLPSRKNYTFGGAMISFQLKTTTEKQIGEKPGFVSYDLRAKNYDDLIFRKNLLQDGYPRVVPLVFILLALPDDPSKWLKVDLTNKSCTMNGIFYWYYPAKEDGFSSKNSSQRIFIPKQNRVDLAFFDYICNQLLNT